MKWQFTKVYDIEVFEEFARDFTKTLLSKKPCFVIGKIHLYLHAFVRVEFVVFSNIKLLCG